MRFDLLGGDDPRWSSLIDRLGAERRDIHFLPSYGAIYRRTYGFQPMLAVLEGASGFVIQPFVKRPLNGLPFLREQQISEPFYDVANPYGYGGPLVEAATPADARELFVAFDGQLCDRLRAEHVASEFTSLHPLLGNHQLVAEHGATPLVEAKDVVYVDLSLSEEQLWQETRRGHKSSINKAKKSGVTVEQISPTPADFDTFNRLYFATMDRNNASDRWYFPDDYFRSCWELLGADRVSFFFARYQGAVVAAWIVMHAFQTAYYHFGGSFSDYYALRPNNLMVHEVALWAKKRGYRYLHLGGGVTAAPDDPLFVFKSGYSHKTARLHTYGRVHDRSTYERLCRFKESHEIATQGEVSRSDFFPLYRR